MAAIPPVPAAPPSVEVAHPKPQKEIKSPKASAHKAPKAKAAKKKPSKRSSDHEGEPI